MLDSFDLMVQFIEVSMGQYLFGDDEKPSEEEGGDLHSADHLNATSPNDFRDLRQLFFHLTQLSPIWPDFEVDRHHGL